MKKPIKKADKLFSDKIKSIGKCEKCGKRKYLQTAHIISRRYKQVRWDLDNALCLCRACHLWGTNFPLEWEEFVLDKIGRISYDMLKTRALQYGKIDYEEIIKKLQKGRTN